jgi:hypothetical protein
VKILMLGAGGTGAHIAPNLYRLLYALKRPVRFIIADGDGVEENNLVRQHFCPAELGMNKARALAERYAFAFGIAPEYVPDFIEDGERLAEFLAPEELSFPGGVLDAKTKKRRYSARELVILIGAVDNNKSRGVCCEVFKAARDLIYIDSGNGESGGQVVCGIRKNGKTLRRSVGDLYPDVLAETDKFPSELSCAEASISAPQAITANVTAATVVVCILYNILARGECDVKSATFSTKSITVRSECTARRKRTARRRPAGQTRERIS